MRIILLFIIFCFTGNLSYCQFIDNFDDGNISDNPSWMGDTSHFMVSSAKQLRLLSAGADTSCLITASGRVADTEWDLWLKMSFNTSANNFCRIYLASDQSNLKGNLSGYFIQVGGAKDSIVFYRQEGSEMFALFKAGSVCTNHSTNILRIKVKHEKNGKWVMLIDPAGEHNYTEEGSCIDTTLTSTSFYGIYCRYTSSNSEKFYFDDIYCGMIKKDSIPPGVTRLKVIGNSDIEITFSEPVSEETTGYVSNYSAGLYGNPSIAGRDSMDMTKVTIHFPVTFSKKFSDTLIIGNIKDLAGNIMNTRGYAYFLNTPSSYEIVIDEIMADPDPSVGLPLSEYLELFNKSDFPADLTGWQLEYGSSKKIFPEVIIQPKGFLIITKDNFMNVYGPSVDLFTSSTSLSNEGTLLVLENEEGKIIHQVDYNNSWYREPVKAEGGWSLEMIDPENPCGCSDNWKGSTNGSGGTPGMVNSVAAVNRDTIEPYIKGIRIAADSSIVIIYSESMDSTVSVDWKLDGVDVISFMIPPLFNEVRLQIHEPLDRDVGYQVTFSGVAKDCAGNMLTGRTTWIVAVPDTINVKDLIINEVLPDPYPGGSRFVEIYNRSEKVLDLRDLVICAFDSVSSGFVDLKNVSIESLLIFPHTYLVLTNNQSDILERYYCPNPDGFVVLNSLPSMTNEYGDLVLIRKNDGFIIDQMKYDDTMHFPLIDNASGISLERVSPDIPAADRNNWHSASFSCGYATPGYQNSQYIQPDITTCLMNIEKPVFSPDNDGFNDILSISFSSEDPVIINLRIFDLEGRLIRNIVSNSIPERKDCFFWDGVDEAGKKALAGIYIVFLEAISRDGTVKSEKKPVVLAVKF